MGILRAQIAFQFDSVLPQDQIMITPHYLGPTTGTDVLADALSTNLKATTGLSASVPFTIKLYNAEGTPPHYPLSTKVNGTGSNFTTQNRDVALCLSYYATFNRPRWRGRMYIPAFLAGGSIGLRPTNAQMTQIGAWANTLGKNLPSGFQWALYSKTRGSAEVVTNWWVDDEWDTVRTRGMKPTTRVQGVVTP